MSIIRVGSTQQYADNWEKAFGQTTKKKAAKKGAKKKAAKKKAANSKK